MRKTSRLMLAVCCISLVTISGCVAYPANTYVYPYTPVPEVTYVRPAIVVPPPVLYYSRPVPYYWSNRGYYYNGYWRPYRY